VCRTHVRLSSSKNPSDCGRLSSSKNPSDLTAGIDNDAFNEHSGLHSARACGNQRVVPDVDTSSQLTAGINQRDVIDVQLAHAQFLIGHCRCCYCCCCCCRRCCCPRTSANALRSLSYFYVVMHLYAHLNDQFFYLFRFFSPAFVECERSCVVDAARLAPSFQDALLLAGPERDTHRERYLTVWSTWVPLVTACCAEPEVRTQYLGQVLLPGYLACAVRVCVDSTCVGCARSRTRCICAFFVVCALLMYELS
jgi:hypothetical protein